MNQQSDVQERATSQLAHYDDLIATYIGIIEGLNQKHAPEETKILIELANESIRHCQNKRAILVNYLDSLQK